MNHPDDDETRPASGPHRWQVAPKHPTPNAPDVPAEEPAAPEQEPVRGDRRRFFSGRTSGADETGPASAVNPFLPPAPTTDDPEAAGGVEDGRAGQQEPGGGFEHVAGPAVPPVAAAPLHAALDLPPVWPSHRPTDAVVQLVGLHGGAGTSTVAGLLGHDALDCGASLENLTSTATPVLLVTRTHAQGLNLALRAGQQHAARGLEPLLVLGLVVVADAPSLSKGLARTLRSVQRTLPHCWTLGWDEDLRHDPDLPAAASSGRTGRDARRILKRARQLRESQTPTNQLRQVR